MAKPAELSPQVEVTDSAITYHRPDGISRSVRWDDLQAVLLQTTDEGPFVMDVWWVLIDADGHCIIPQEVSGEAELLEQLQKLPGFDNEAVIAAMSSVENQQFVCWQR